MVEQLPRSSKSSFRHHRRMLKRWHSKAARRNGKAMEDAAPRAIGGWSD